MTLTFDVRFKTLSFYLRIKELNKSVKSYERNGCQKNLNQFIYNCSKKVKQKTKHWNKAVDRRLKYLLQHSSKYSECITSFVGFKRCKIDSVIHEGTWITSVWIPKPCTLITWAKLIFFFEKWKRNKWKVIISSCEHCVFLNFGTAKQQSKTATRKVSGKKKLKFWKSDKSKHYSVQVDDTMLTWSNVFCDRNIHTKSGVLNKVMDAPGTV